MRFIPIGIDNPQARVLTLARFETTIAAFFIRSRKPKQPGNFNGRIPYRKKHVLFHENAVDHGYLISKTVCFSKDVFVFLFNW